MKRIACLALIALLLCGCAVSEETEAPPEVDIEAIREAGYNEGYALGYVDGVASVALEPTEKQPSAQAQTESAAQTPTKLDPVFIFEDEYVKIEFAGCEADDRRDELVFRVQNKTDVELTFQAGSIAIDGEDLGSIGGSDGIAARSAGNVRFNSYDSEKFPTLTPNRITGTIKVIDFSKKIFERNSQSYDVSFVDVPCKEEESVPVDSGLPVIALTQEEIEVCFGLAKTFIRGDQSFPEVSYSIKEDNLVEIVAQSLLAPNAGTEEEIAELAPICKNIAVPALSAGNDLIAGSNDGIAKSDIDNEYMGGVYDIYSVRLLFERTDGSVFLKLYMPAGSGKLEIEK